MLISAETFSADKTIATSFAARVNAYENNWHQIRSRLEDIASFPS